MQPTLSPTRTPKSHSGFDIGMPITGHGTQQERFDLSPLKLHESLLKTFNS
jgi:hypothetical protein